MPGFLLLVAVVVGPAALILASLALIAAVVALISERETLSDPSLAA